MERFFYGIAAKVPCSVEIFSLLELLQKHDATKEQAIQRRVETRCFTRTGRSQMPSFHKENMRFLMLHFDLDMAAGWPAAFCTSFKIAYLWYTRQTLFLWL